MATNGTHCFSNGIGRDENDHEERGDTYRTPSCHSRIHVRDVISERGSVTLCRHCQTQFLGVSS